MNKAELVEYMAKSADISKSSTTRCLDAALQAITETLKKGESVTLVGFGTFDVGERAARTGRNPRTGETIQIASSKMPKFRPGKQLRDTVNE